MSAQTISLPTQRDRDTGVVLFFLSLVSYYALPALAYEFGFPHGTVAFLTTPLGVLLMVVGIACLFFSRKTVVVEPGTVRIKDGLFRRPLNLRFESTPTIKLSVYEESRSNGRVDEIWTVHLVDGGRQYLIDRRVGQHGSVRSLAERLAKYTKGSLVEIHDGQSHSFELEELDLPFVERVERYPALMGTPVEEPTDKVVSFSSGPNGIEVGWSFFRSSLLWEIITVSGLLFGAAFIPLPGGSQGEGFSLYQAEQAQGDYRYFIALIAFTLLSLGLLSGYRNRIWLNATSGALSQSTIWGIPVRTGKIPIEKLEHVGVSVTSRGPYLQLISDETILREQLPSTHIARWIAWKMRQYLVEGPVKAQAQTETEPRA